MIFRKNATWGGFRMPLWACFFMCKTDFQGWSVHLPLGFTWTWTPQSHSTTMRTPLSWKQQAAWIQYFRAGRYAGQCAVIQGVSHTGPGLKTSLWTGHLPVELRLLAAVLQPGLVSLPPSSKNNPQLVVWKPNLWGNAHFSKGMGFIFYTWIPFSKCPRERPRLQALSLTESKNHCDAHLCGASQCSRAPFHHFVWVLHQAVEAGRIGSSFT